jgi:hypothetical protein
MLGVCIALPLKPISLTLCVDPALLTSAPLVSLGSRVLFQTRHQLLGLCCLLSEMDHRKP